MSKRHLHGEISLKKRPDNTVNQHVRWPYWTEISCVLFLSMIFLNMISTSVLHMDTAVSRNLNLSIAPSVVDVNSATAVQLQETFRLHTGFVRVDISRVTIWTAIRRINAGNVLQKKESMLVGLFKFAGRITVQEEIYNDCPLTIIHERNTLDVRFPHTVLILDGNHRVCRIFNESQVIGHHISL